MRDLGRRGRAAWWTGVGLLCVAAALREQAPAAGPVVGRAVPVRAPVRWRARPATLQAQPRPPERVAGPRDRRCRPKRQDGPAAAQG